MGYRLWVVKIVQVVQIVEAIETAELLQIRNSKLLPYALCLTESVITRVVRTHQP